MLLCKFSSKFVKSHNKTLVWNQSHANACLFTQSAAERATLITCRRSFVNETFFLTNAAKKKSIQIFYASKMAPGEIFKFSGGRETSAISHTSALDADPADADGSSAFLSTRNAVVSDTLFICSGQWEPQSILLPHSDPTTTTATPIWSPPSAAPPSNRSSVLVGGNADVFCLCLRSNKLSLSHNTLERCSPADTRRLIFSRSLLHL